jgi:hypothetical protein
MWFGIKPSPFATWGCGSLEQQLPNRIIPGINHLFLYVGGTTGPSPFRLHVEDNLLYSLNYLHTSCQETT